MHAAHSARPCSSRRVGRLLRARRWNRFGGRRLGVEAFATLRGIDPAADTDLRRRGLVDVGRDVATLFAFALAVGAARFAIGARRDARSCIAVTESVAAARGLVVAGATDSEGASTRTPLAVQAIVSETSHLRSWKRRFAAGQIGHRHGDARAVIVEASHGAGFPPRAARPLLPAFGGAYTQGVVTLARATNVWLSRLRLALVTFRAWLAQLQLAAQDVVARRRFDALELAAANDGPRGGQALPSGARVVLDFLRVRHAQRGAPSRHLRLLAPRDVHRKAGGLTAIGQAVAHQVGESGRKLALWNGGVAALGLAAATRERCR
jgi:hypothetical protein